MSEETEAVTAYAYRGRLYKTQKEVVDAMLLQAVMDSMAAVAVKYYLREPDEAPDQPGRDG